MKQDLDSLSASEFSINKVSAWPEADRLFHLESNWLGGDSAYSIDLGKERSLWLFGDSFIAISAKRVRSESVLIRNSIALQVGSDPTSASMDFFWNEHCTPSSYFTDVSDDEWYWPGAGSRIGDSVLLFLLRIKRVSYGLGFETVGAEARLIENPDDSPELFRTRNVAMPRLSKRIYLSTGAVVSDQHLYVHGVEEPSHDVYLARFTLTDAQAGDLTRPEWFTAKGWSTDNEPDPVRHHSATEFSVHSFDGIWCEIQAEGFGAVELGLRVAKQIEGPWSRSVKFYRPPEADRSDVLIYAAKAHPQLSGGDILVSYSTNSLNSSELISDSSLYYPRFVRLWCGAS